MAGWHRRPHRGCRHRRHLPSRRRVSFRHPSLTGRLPRGPLCTVRYCTTNSLALIASLLPSNLFRHFRENRCHRSVIALFSRSALGRVSALRTRTSVQNCTECSTECDLPQLQLHLATPPRYLHRPSQPTCLLSVIKSKLRTASISLRPPMHPLPHLHLIHM